MAELPPAIADVPLPTNAGVLGMQRTTATPGPAAASMVARFTPAAIDRIRRAPAPTTADVAAGTSGGLTARTAARQGGVTPSTATSGYMSRN